MTPKDILTTAETIVNGDRQADYGHPRDNHGCTAAMMEAYMHRRFQSDIKAGLPSRLFTARDVCVFNILQKVSRLANTPTHADSLVDIVGYALNMAMIQDAEKPTDNTTTKGAGE